MLGKILVLIIVIGVAATCYYFGKNITIEEQIPLLEGLRNTAAIIFGVMGAWIAILHPESLKKIFSRNGGSVSLEDRETINLLLSPILISTFILFIVLVMPLAISIGKTIPYVLEYKHELRGFSFAILGCLTILQLWTLILTLIPGDLLKRNIQKQEAKEAMKNRMFSGTRKKRE